MYHKEICYDRETRDFAMYLDGQLVGFARTYTEADVKLDQHVFDLLIDGAYHTAANLDGGAEPEPTDAPGDDCPDHGPYADDECPKCATCDDPNMLRCAYCAGDCESYCPECNALCLA